MELVAFMENLVQSKEFTKLAFILHDAIKPQTE